MFEQDSGAFVSIFANVHIYFACIIQMNDALNLNTII